MQLRCDVLGSLRWEISKGAVVARAKAPKPVTPPTPKDAKVSPYEKIKTAIVHGELQSGQVLVETTLAEWCGVSRTPIREALRRLEHDGLVTWGERGLMVRKRTPTEIIDAYDLRTLLEATAARVAAERRTSHDVMWMRRRAELCDTNPQTDPIDMMLANQRFHESVWTAAHNESLFDLLDRMRMHLQYGPSKTLSQPGRWDEGCRQHHAIVDAIEARDGDTAYALTEHHFRQARDLRVELLAAAVEGPGEDSA